jgi:hypothetical protein
MSRSTRSSSGYAAVVAIAAQDPPSVERIDLMATAEITALTASPPTRPSSQRVAGTRSTVRRIDCISNTKTIG